MVDSGVTTGEFWSGTVGKSPYTCGEERFTQNLSGRHRLVVPVHFLLTGT